MKKFMSVVGAICVLIITIVSPVQTYAARYAEGVGSISLINETTGWDPYSISASTRNGGGFFGDTTAYPGRFDLRLYVPDAYFSARLSFFSLSGDFAPGSMGVVKMYATTDLYPTPVRQGVFTLSSFSRDSDGVVSTFNASFDQEIIYALCPLLETHWEGQLTYQSLPASIVPEPTTLTLMLAGAGIILIRARRR